METKDILLDITPENMAEAEFMCANFVDQEVKNRVFVNTLGAEAGITYLANNGFNIEDLRNIHSIKRVIGKTNIADIILHNIHIDVRVVFNKDVIFVPKSHFELEITPDAYMVLLFNQDLKNMEFLGYFEPSVINKEHCNDDYYFVDISDLKEPDAFVDFIKNYSGNTEKELTDSEILKGRELAVLTSDEDISDGDYKEFLNLLKTSLALRDSILEYDNFETLAGMVASFRQSGNSSVIDNNASNTAEGVEQEADLSDSANDIDISLNEDLNGDDLIDDDNFGQPLDNSLSELGDIGGGLASNEAIELAGMAGDSIENHDDISNMDIGTSDIDFQDSGADFGMDVDLFDSTLDESLSENSDSTFGESDNNESTGSVADVGDNIEDGLSDVVTPNLSELETEDLSNDIAIPTEAVSDMEQDLSLEQEDLLDTDLNLSEDDLLPLDEGENPLDNIADQDSTDENSIPDMVSDGGETNLEKMEFVSDNTEVSSYEEYDATLDDNSHKTGFEKGVINNEDAESFDFSDLGLNAEDIDTSSQDNAQEEENLFDFTSVSEITEQPVSQENEISGSNSLDGDFSNEEVQFEDYQNADFKDFEEITESPSDTVINSENEDEVLITDDVINNSEVIENSTVISDKDFEPGEIILDINRPNLPEFEDSQIGELYNDSAQQGQNPAGLNNGTRISARSVLSSKYGIIGLFLIIAVAGVIIFSVAKMLNKPAEEPQPITSGLNPESKVNNNSQDAVKLNPDDVVMNEGENGVKTAATPKSRRQIQKEEQVQELPSKPIPPTAFLSVSKLSWEVPDYVSYSGEFRQFFQSSGKSLKTALTSDLLLADDYTYNNVIKLSITFDKNGKFTSAKIISSSGSSNVDKIVLQSVNQTLNILKAPSSLENNENTTVILKIYL